MSRILFVLAATAIVVAAGCIKPDDPNSAPAADRAASHGGSMSADEKRSDASTICTSGGINVGGSGSQAFCAQRTITVSGTISGLSKIDVDLSTFNGDVKVHESSGDSWGFVATLRARGSTADEASSRLNDIAFTWSHTNGDGHFVQVQAKQSKQNAGDEGLGADLDVTMPSSMTLVLSAATGNGNLHVQGGQTDGLTLTTGNGNVDATTKVTSVELRSGNGNANGALTPTGSGRIVVTTGNGNADLALPEDEGHGYTADLSTGNGKLTVGLHDGATSPCPAEAHTPCNHRTFETTGFAKRSIQSRITVSTGNGDLTLRSA